MRRDQETKHRAMPQPWKEVGRYGGVGIELVLSILILSWVGHWLDVRCWGDKGWGLGAGFFLGVAVGFRNLIRTAQHMQRDIERAEAHDPEAGRWNVDPQWLHPDPGPPPDEAKTAAEADEEDRVPEKSREGS